MWVITLAPTMTRITTDSAVTILLRIERLSKNVMADLRR
jgi:hypothetical protein